VQLAHVLVLLRTLALTLALGQVLTLALVLGWIPSQGVLDVTSCTLQPHKWEFHIKIRHARYSSR
jgi:hypothetical protein